MTLQTDKAEELIALTNRLAELIEGDVVILRAKRPAELAGNDGNRAETMLLYARTAGELQSFGPLEQLPASVRTRVRTASGRLQKAVKEQNRLLIRFRHVTEGLIKAVADVVVAREAPSVYGKSGTYATSKLDNRGAAMTINRAV
jgi:hypothetical protein